MQTSDRLSADPAAVLGCGILTGARSGSTRAASSARPISVSSGGSSGGCSVRWDEARLQTMKEAGRKERALKKDKDSTRKGKKSQETRKTSDSRERAPLASVFPGEMSELQEDEGRYDEGVPIPSIMSLWTDMDKAILTRLSSGCVQDQ